MNVEPNQAKSIFLEAVEKHHPDQWPAFLDQACAGQPELRRRVEVLLEAHREAGTAPYGANAESPDPAPLDDNGSVEHPGSVIGPYKLLQQIGEGGMGTVWMAEQTHPVQRKVALKLIKSGMDSRQVIARFEAERQALALMDHPNIARVFDAGTTESSRHTPCAVASDGTRSVPTTLGRPYFVMELVKGVPITRYCDEHHLTPRQRLELFVPVCQAVQHAHQKGIIHRDLKPSNAMVCQYDGKPVPKVIDFGIAKATGSSLTEKTLFTEIGQVVGTLEYMSPEQAELNQLDIDTRSDIYSLGVLLYELLTGSTPLTHKRMKEAAYAEILRMIKEEEPPKPSTRLSDSGEALASISAQRHMEPAKLTKLVRGAFSSQACPEICSAKRVATIVSGLAVQAFNPEQDRRLHVATLADRITVDPEQCGGRPCIRGMRIRVSDVLDLLANGLSPEQIIEELPDLEPADVQACLRFASRRVADPEPVA